MSATIRKILFEQGNSMGGDVSLVFEKYVSEQTGLLNTENLGQALTEVGIDEDQGRSIVQAHTCADAITLEQFDNIITLCTLQEHDFPTDKLEAMLVKLQDDTGVVNIEKLEAIDRLRFERFLKSYGVSLEDMKITNEVSLDQLAKRLASELDNKRKAEWLQETGVLKAIASHLPSSVSQAARGKTWEGREGELSEDIACRLHSIGGLIESKAKEKLCADSSAAKPWNSFNDRHRTLAQDPDQSGTGQYFAEPDASAFRVASSSQRIMRAKCSLMNLGESSQRLVSYSTARRNSCSHS
eukprot:1290224-Rhodomonas_salina.1